MDTRLQTVLEDIHHVNTINNHKRLLKEQFYEAITIYYNGGRFTANNAFISFLNTACENSIDVIVDDNDIPVSITDMTVFRELAITTYKNATFQYYEQYEKSSSVSRSVEEMLDL